MDESCFKLDTKLQHIEVLKVGIVYREREIGKLLIAVLSRMANLR